MQIKEKFINFFSIGKKAGYIKEGYNNTEALLVKKVITVIFLSPKLSKNSKRKFDNYSLKYNIPIYEDEIVDEIAIKFNNPELMILGVMNKAYTEKLIALYKDYNKTEKAGGE